MRQRPLTVGIVALALALAAGLIWFALSSDQSGAAQQPRRALTPISLNVRDGHPVPPARRYKVRVGSIVQVTLRSSELGKVEVDTSPPSFVEMTTNPVVVDFMISQQRDYAVRFKRAGPARESVVVAVVGGV